MTTQHDKLMRNPEYRKLFAIEGAITEASELVARLMAEAGITKAELARRLGKSRAYVTQLLGGTNMTVRTLAEVAFELGAEMKLDARPRAKKSNGSKAENHDGSLPRARERQSSGRELAL
jgi:transcriptional regulator with XRE-family HTH domain